MLIQKWGRSSAASTAVSIADAMRSLVTPTPEGDWFSSGVLLSKYYFLFFFFLDFANTSLIYIFKCHTNTGLHKWKSLWDSRRHSF